MRKYISDCFYLGIFFLFVVLFFYPTFLHSRLPIPIDALVGLYHPWRDFYADSNPRGVPFKNFLTTDPIRQQIPWRKIAVDEWRQGKIPWWNPYSFGGVPLAANIQAGIFNPLNFLFFIFSFPVAWTILIFLQPIFSGIFMYVYLKHLSVQSIVSLFAAAAWSFSGFHIAWFTWGTMVHVSLWLPVLLLCVDKNFQRPSIMWSMLLVIALVFQFFSGHVQIFLYTSILVLFYVIWKLYKIRKIYSVLWLIFAFIFFLFIASVQWVPFLQFILHSSRLVDASLWLKDGWFLPWQHIVQFFVPDFFGNPSTLNYWGTWNYGEFIGYVSIVPILFLIYSFFIKNDVMIFWKIALFIVILLILPTPLAKIPYQLNLPIISSLQPTRLMVILDFCIIMLAALGMNHWLEKKDKKIWFCIGLVGCVFIIIFGVIFFRQLIPSEVIKSGLDVSRRNTILPFAIFIAVSILIGSAQIFIKRRIFVLYCLVGVLLVTGFDLLRFGWKFIPFVSTSYFFPVTEVIKFLSQKEKPFRVMNMNNEIFPPNVLSFYGIESIDGYDPIYLRRYEEFIAASERGKSDINSPYGFNRIITPHNVDSPLISLLNVKYVTSLNDISRPYLRKIFQEGETRVYENLNSLPRAYFAETIIHSLEKQKILDLLFESSSMNYALLEEEVDVSSSKLLDVDLVKISLYSSSYIKINTVSDAQRFLVVSNIWYPNWTVKIDGKYEKLYRVNFLFMGLKIPAGAHTVIFEYH